MPVSTDVEDNEPSGSETTVLAIPAQLENESENQTSASQPIALQRSTENDAEDVEARLPPDRSSLKSSLKVEDSILRLNIGGSSYRLRTRSILKYGPNTLLGRLVRMDHDHKRLWSDGWFEESNEYYFERCPRYFDGIYDFYCSGKLHVDKHLCLDRFMSELRYWAINKAKIDDCCSFSTYLNKKLPSGEHPSKDHFVGLRWAQVRRRLWLVLEGHSNSKWWKFFEVTSTSFVVLSITALILSSMPEFQVPETARAPEQFPVIPVTYPTYPKVAGFTVASTTVNKEPEETKPEMVEHPVFTWVEHVCVIYFTLEYLLRFFVAPRKGPFVKEFLNIIDLLAIAPFFFELILFFVGLSGDNVRKVRWAFLTVRLLRVLRVVRIVKLGRFSPGLANFALTLRKSKKQMQMVGIVFMTLIIFFSTLVYFLERDQPGTVFLSIPDAMWWCLFSQTKWVPQSAPGKLVGGTAILVGLNVLALPIVIVINNYLGILKLREEKVIKKYAQQRTSGDHV
ncbi:Ion-trans domain-containing protein [Aphelenchoides besseyi]|nr:Ion-trans domain-containing protein [Aphelenchoides besseyi]